MRERGRNGQQPKMGVYFIGGITLGATGVYSQPEHISVRRAL